MKETMRPLEALPLKVRRDIGIVLCDIDDTLTTDGRLPAVSYQALERLQQAGLDPGTPRSQGTRWARPRCWRPPPASRRRGTPARVGGVGPGTDGPRRPDG